MRTSRRHTILVAAAALLAGAPTDANEQPEERAIVHVLNRVAFGARPDDIEAVRRMGVRAYIERQLEPGRIADAAATSRLSALASLSMSSREIADAFARPLIENRRLLRQQGKDSPDTRRTPGAPGVDAMRNSTVPVVELSTQKIVRAIYSERQLQEVLTDFWFNHFNVDARKGQTRFFLTEYERDAIRPNVLGRFRDLLGATAKSPAMLFYLDNWLSADPAGPHIEPTAGRGARMWRPGAPAMAAQPAQNRLRNGLNENYARELLELHTVGVDGGYAQNDVTEVARAFTGWTIGNPRQGGGFRFDPRLHVRGDKVVMGHRITAGDIGDGEQVLDLLARHPSTARFIATKLARRFVRDTPSDALIEHVAAKFRATDGDLREVMRTLLLSAEFLDAGAYRAKVKTPFEFVVSALRATDARVDDARPLVRVMADLGMPLYQCQPPTGYKDAADAWANSGALINRMNTAITLASNQVRGSVVTDTAGGLRLDAVLAYDLSTATKDTIVKATTETERLALTLGSPEFQRR